MTMPVGMRRIIRMQRRARVERMLTSCPDGLGHREGRQSMGADVQTLAIASAGFIAGYLIRSLMSRVRRRRHDRDFGLNPRKAQA
jgi:hypothetical protein